MPLNAAEACHAASAEEVATWLGTDSATGLTAVEADRRARLHGPNALPDEPGPGAFSLLLKQIRDPLVAVLLAGVIVLNAVIGYVQESRARQALDALARMVHTQATVVREGIGLRIAAEALVPGDVVELTAGNQVPADLRLLGAQLLETDESALTGESVPVAKTTGPLPERTPLADRVNMAYSGTMVTRGTGRALVTATGAGTQLGAIQRLVATSGTVATPLTRKLAGFSKQLSTGIVAVAALAFAVGLLRRSPVPEMSTAAVALAVGAIPEGLPAAVSIVLAIGVVRMSRRRSVVRNLPAVETLPDRSASSAVCAGVSGAMRTSRPSRGTTVRRRSSGGVTGPESPIAAAFRGPVPGVRDLGLAERVLSPLCAPRPASFTPVTENAGRERR
ncbi:HAD-IC family P-type ATPase [Amycolatopsis acidicola]|uniref:HAD-IC family P-type ATPase n=1 Tax=Amycolatopsis acidicola TaxID=2596893 RepID=A0A5N0V1E2_9PSEU|nr:HAD-IC family P-type ATPase [Amycolatopsis acidicola]